jgi:AcrR family transcriptional regulator
VIRPSPLASGPRTASKPSRRRLPPAARRAELLDAAIGVLRSQGPEGCRVEDITNAAGTAKGNFYRYFPTWDDLLIAVRDHLLDSYSTDLARRYAGLSTVDWWAAVDDEIRRFIDFQLGLGGLHQAVFHGPAAVTHPIETHRSAASTVAWFLAAGIADGAFAPVDVDATALLLFDLLHSAADAIASGLARERGIAATLHIVHRTLEPGGPDARPARAGAGRPRGPGEL